MRETKKQSIWVWVGTALTTLALAMGNHLINEKSVDFTNPPEILPKPGDWPSLSLMEGLVGGVKVFFKEIEKHPWGVSVALGVLLAGLILGIKYKKPSPLAWSKSWFRIFLGGMFILAATPKFLDPEGFSILVAQYQMLPIAWVPLFSLLLPAGEIVVGLGLILSPFEKDFSAMTTLLWIMFIVALAQALSRGLGIACGCFDIDGATDAGETWFALLRDIVLVFPTLWMAIKGNSNRPLWRV